MAAGALAEEVVEEVATNLEEVAQATRQLDARALGYLGIGIGVGVVVGFYFGHKWNREKIRAEAFKASEEEVEAIRETYRRKELVAVDKPTVEQIIEERGYSTHADLERPLPAPVPIIETPSALVAAPDEPVVPVVEDTGKNKDLGWSYPVELARRSPDAPYIIHQDEFSNSEHGYEKVVYTYWSGDDVLTDEDNQPLVNGVDIVGADNLKWGHGADDFNVVFVRNDKLNLEAEICRDPRSWEEEVGGLDGPEDTLRHSAQARPAPRRPKRRSD